MNLFEIDKEIENALSSVTVDETTGEIQDFSAIEELLAEREAKIKNIALYILNLTADMKGVEEQEKKFTERKKALSKKIDGLKNYLDAYLNGESKKYDECIISYRKSEQVNISDDTAFRKYAENHEEYLKYSEPTPDKTAIKNAIKNGVTIDGCEIVTKNNMSIK